MTGHFYYSQQGPKFKPKDHQKQKKKKKLFWENQPHLIFLMLSLADVVMEKLATVSPLQVDSNEQTLKWV